MTAIAYTFAIVMVIVAAFRDDLNEWGRNR